VICERDRLIADWAESALTQADELNAMDIVHLIRSWGDQDDALVVAGLSDGELIWMLDVLPGSIDNPRQSSLGRSQLQIIHALLQAEVRRRIFGEAE
jgi:hypothetical protein